MKSLICKDSIFVFFVLLLALVFPIQLQAQLTRGAISGTVRDPNGAVVAGANVKVTDNATNLSRDTTTSDDGFYRIGALEPGVYTVKIEKTGFVSAENKAFRVNTATETTFDVDLKVGNVTESIDITAQTEAVTLNKTTGTIGSIIDSRRAQELPLGAARNVNNLALLSPNVFVAPGSSGISANGQRARNNNFTIDGSDNNDITVTIATTPVVAEAVSEFQIQTNPYNAENGRNTGASINVTTRSGTNKYHGAFWDYYRGSDLNAMDNVEKRNPNLTTPTRFNRNQYGFSIGGPIYFLNVGDDGPQIYDGRDKTFFFFLYQGDKQRTGRGVGATIRIPTPAGYAALTGPGIPLRTGQSPASRAAVINALNFLPGIYAQNPSFTTLCRFAAEPVNPALPNCANVGGGVEIRTGLTNVGIVQPFDASNYTARLDHKLTDNDNLTLRYIFNKSAQENVVSNLNFGSLYAGDQFLKDGNLAFSESHVFNSSVINEFRFSFIRRNLDFPEHDTGTPTTAVGQFTTFGGLNNFPQSRVSNFYQFSNTTTWTSGKHTIRFGGDLRYNILKNFSGFDFKGTFTFTTIPNYVNNNASTFVQAFSAADFDAKQLQQFYFIQDDWRITSSLTLNLGLRYETAGVPFGFFGTTDPAQLAARVQPPVKRDTNNWAPVLGFAYSPSFEGGFMGKLFGNRLTSIRGGFRTAYDVLFYNILVVNAGNFPITTSVTQNNVLDVYPFLAPGGNPPVFNPLATFVNSPSDVENPESYLYSLSIQREIGRQFVFEIGYAGSRSINGINQLQLNPATLTQTQINRVIAARNAGPAGGPFTCPAGGPVGPQASPADCAGTVQSRRLFNTLGQRVLIAGNAQATYNSGFVSLKKRFSRGLSFDMAYTFSRLISNNDESLGVGAITTGSPQIPQDFFNYNAEKSLSAFDRTHRFVTNFIYEIPMPGFIKKNSFANTILGGFQLAGIVSHQSGQPFSIQTGVDSNGNGQLGDRPNFNPNGTFSLDPVTGNWRTFTSPLVGGAFFVPLTGINGLTGTPLANSMGNGNLGKNTFRAPGFWNSDLSVLKRFVLPWGGEGKHRIDIRADFLNAFNQDNYGIPVNNMNSADFGRNLNNWGNRSITLSGKYTF